MKAAKVVVSGDAKEATGNFAVEELEFEQKRSDLENSAVHHEAD